jgi:hypothetical protein
MMRRRTEVEKFTNRGETLRLEIVTMRSPLAPQWWEVRRRFRWWRLEQRVKSNRNMLSQEAQTALAWAEEALEREFLYGKD